MKLANNVINATSFAITSEAIAFGTHAGLDLAQMLDILNVSTGRTSASLEKFPQGVLKKSPVPGAPGEIIAKDVALFLAEAAHVGTPVEVSSVVGAVWADYVTEHPNTDSIELFRYLNERTEK
jgi:3-hydroxyisobutyrate dehydrogenase-like beta-hydroxyacid dehydrogenase